MSGIVNSVVNMFAVETQRKLEDLPNNSERGVLELDKDNTTAALMKGTRNGAIVAGSVAVIAALVAGVTAAVFFGAPIAALAVVAATLGALTLPILVGAAVITALSLTALVIFIAARNQADKLEDGVSRGTYVAYNDTHLTLRVPKDMEIDEFLAKSLPEQVNLGTRI